MFVYEDNNLPSEANWGKMAIEGLGLVLSRFSFHVISNKLFKPLQLSMEGIDK
jgi:hypothetical protein